MMSDLWRYSRPLATSSSCHKVRSVESLQRGSDDPRSHQADPVCSLLVDVFSNISVLHHLRDHGKLSGLRFDFDRGELKDVGMR